MAIGAPTEAVARVKIAAAVPRATTAVEEGTGAVSAEVTGVSRTGASCCRDPLSTARGVEPEADVAHRYLGGKFSHDKKKIRAIPTP